VPYFENMRSDENPLFLGVSGTAAGAGLASAVVGAFPIIAVMPGSLVPLAGAGVALGAMWISGVLKDPKASISKGEVIPEAVEDAAS
jgi:hypothetical protein